MWLTCGRCCKGRKIYATFARVGTGKSEDPTVKYIGELFFSLAFLNWNTVKVVCMNKTVSVGCFICTKVVAGV